MSSTNRNSPKTKRHKTDFYATPEWAIEKLLDAYPQLEPTLDPCAGDGVVLRVAAKYGHAMLGLELNPEVIGAEPVLGDGLALNWREERVLTNPPYSQSLAFVRKGAEEAEWSFWLLRLNWLGGAYTAKGKFRAQWLAENPPRVIATLAKRPKFKHGKSDSCEYAWIGYGNIPGAPSGGTRFHVLL